MERVVFLFDVDNTLIDNDRIAADLKLYLTKEVGHGRQEQYWRLFEELRVELGYADYLGALQRYRVKHPREPHLPAVSSFLVNSRHTTVLVDDKVRILAAIKQRWNDRLTTVFPRQGRYANAPDVAHHPVPDVTIDRIGDLTNYDMSTLLNAARQKRTR